VERACRTYAHWEPSMADTYLLANVRHHVPFAAYVWPRTHLDGNSMLQRRPSVLKMRSTVPLSS
jgi:hypothetical protein